MNYQYGTGTAMYTAAGPLGDWCSGTATAVPAPAPNRHQANNTALAYPDSCAHAAIVLPMGTAGYKGRVRVRNDYTSLASIQVGSIRFDEFVNRCGGIYLQQSG